MGERERHAPPWRCTAICSALRREDPAFARPRGTWCTPRCWPTQALALRFFAPEGDGAGRPAADRQPGRDLGLASVAEPLLAPPAGQALAHGVVQRGPRYGGAARRRWRPTRAGVCPATRRSCSPRRRRHDRDRRSAAERDAADRIGWRRGEAAPCCAREWLLTNGLGGYASGTLGGAPTRRFHGLLVAALPAPFGRMMMLNHLAETLVPADGAPIALTGSKAGQAGDCPTRSPSSPGERPPGLDLRTRGARAREAHRLAPPAEHLHVSYRLVAGDRPPVVLTLEPAFDVRPHEGRSTGGAAD